MMGRRALNSLKREPDLSSLLSSMSMCSTGIGSDANAQSAKKVASATICFLYGGYQGLDPSYKYVGQILADITNN